MPPLGPLLKNDGPACRVCGCTEHNACVTIEQRPHPLMRPKSKQLFKTAVCCSWARTERGCPDLPLCSACSGTEADMAEALKRGCDLLAKGGNLAIAAAIRVGRAALARRKARSATQ